MANIQKMTNAKKLRIALEEEKCLVVPGGFDAFTMALAETAGFKAGYLGGYSLSASITRTPDWGLITMTEMLNAAINAINTVNIPLVCDIDQGFGALSNFVRTIHAYEQAGVAAVHFEDQPFPKKCSLMQGRTVIPIEDNVKKIRAAIETREDSDFVLLARTDAQQTEGRDGILRRIDAYLEAGVDYCIYVEYENEEDLTVVGREFPGKVFAFTGDAPEIPACYFPFKAYGEMGYKAIIYCAPAFCAAHKAIRDLFKTMKEEGQLTLNYHLDHCCNLNENNTVNRIEKWQALRDKYDML